MKTLNTLLLSSFAILVLIPAAIAQENEDPESSSLTEDSRAFQFRITDNFNLTSFNGSAFSYKWHKSESNARRFGISFNNRYQHVDDSVINDNDESTENESETTRLYFNITVNYNWIHYPDTDSEIRFFYGYGPAIGTRLIRNNNEKDDRNTSDQTIQGTIGAAGFSGVEWFFHRSMSLHAEYRAGISFTYERFDSKTDPSEDSSIIEREQTRDNTTVELRSSGVRFGISVYF